MTSKTGVEASASIYWNDMLMKKIIGYIEQFKDRNSLELTSRRLRELCLKTPITKNTRYAIRLDEDPNWPSFYSLLMLPRNEACRLSVRTCSDVPVNRSYEIVSFCYKEKIHNPGIFFKGVRKRLLSQIGEFEIKCRRFTANILAHIQLFPNLNKIVVKNARNFSADENGINFEFPVLERINSLALTLDQQWCSEIELLKRLINPNLKHFLLHVNPSQFKDAWFVEEVMVEVSVHEILLETCQLIFPNPQMPRDLIVAMTQFMCDRSKIVQIFIKNGVDCIPHATKIVPKVSIQFHSVDDSTLELLIESCPSLFHKAEIIELENLHEDHCSQILHALPMFYSIKELYISGSHQKEALTPIDEILIHLPSSLKTLHLNHCKFTQSTTDILIYQCATSLQNLCLVGNGYCNTVQNLSKILDGLEDLRTLEVDMCIPHLLFGKIVEHAKLERLIGFINGNPSEKSLKILDQHFNHVSLLKINRQKQRLTVSNASQH